MNSERCIERLQMAKTELLNIQNCNAVDEAIELIQSLEAKQKSLSNQVSKWYIALQRERGTPGYTCGSPEI